ncbi:MAG: isoprenylcysteine carboxylmethyltransferase family protein [Deltaproteobacteria bacterium]|nr:isoprenylcysteine carboxylmethyltransferase family protein [Deltaproteobacteria bacterium]
MLSLVRSTLSVIVIVTLLLVCAPAYMLRWEALIRGALQPLLPYSGVVLVALGLTISFSGTYYLMRRGGGTPLMCRGTQRLVVAGPYAYLQHPILLGVLVMVFGEALWLSSVSVGTYALALTIMSHYYVVHIEEPRLIRRFGPDYRAYQRAVPRWLPHRTSWGDEER